MRVLLALSSLAVAVLVARQLDRWFLLQAGLVYPPDTTVVYRTAEYEFRAHINTLGFRGDEAEPGGAGGRLRILILVLGAFRQSDEALYFELDQHFTVAGNRFFADQILPFVERELRRVVALRETDRGRGGI